MEDSSDFFPAVDPPPTRRTATDPSRTVYVRFTRPTMENHADLAGRFPHMALNGSQYHLVMYAEDSNYIHVELMTSRNAKEFVSAYSRDIAFFAKQGMKPKFLRFDN
jgi:hypothetical protein